MANAIDVWTSILTSWATLVLLFITTGYLVDERLSEANKADLVGWLQTALQIDDIDWYKQINEYFILIFDTIYHNGKSFHGQVALTIIWNTYLALLILRMASWVSAFELLAPRAQLAAALLAGVSLTVVIILWSKYSNTTHQIIQPRVHPTDTIDTQSGKPPMTKQQVIFFIIITWVFVVISHSLYLYWQHQIDLVEGLIQSLGIGALGLVLATAFVVVSNRILAGVELVNPYRAIMSSLIFIISGFLLVPNARTAYIDAIETLGFITVSFLTLNIAADTVSLIETRWILRKSLSASVYTLPLLFITDLVLSGVIYLLLPIIVGQDLFVLWKSVQFSGPKPWIGILFWTTFSTSAIFYLFAIAVVIIQIQKPILPQLRQIGQALQIEENPTFFIAIVISLLVTLAYAGITIAIL